MLTKCLPCLFLISLKEHYLLKAKCKILLRINNIYVAIRTQSYKVGQWIEICCSEISLKLLTYIDWNKLEIHTLNPWPLKYIRFNCNPQLWCKEILLECKKNRKYVEYERNTWLTENKAGKKREKQKKKEKIGNKEQNHLPNNFSIKYK